MSELRQDQRQWLIYQEEPVTAGIEAIEVIALTVAGSMLASDENVEMRAMGNIMMRWADARQRKLDGQEANDSEHAAISMAVEVLDWMGEEDAEKPESALEQFHAVAFQFDSTLQGAGINGDGWYSVLARGEHGR